MKLSEDAVRRKIVELLDGMDQVRMDVWIFSATLSMVVDEPLVHRIMLEEITLRSHEVQVFWGGTCVSCLSGLAHPN